MKALRKILFAVLFLSAAGIALYSGYQVLSVLSQRHISNTVNEELNRQALVCAETRNPDALPTTASGSGNPPEEPAGETQPPRETVPVRVNFEYLQDKNEDVAGWIYCEDTPISYPFLQSADNNYYLYRLIDGTQNPSGSLFLDFRNSFDLSDWNSIIYGHNMHDGTMFACLNEYKKQEYYDSHPIMYLLTPDTEYRVELIAGISARADASFYDFPVPEDRQEAVIQEWLAASTFETHADILPGDRFVTLSTCTYEYDNARFVVIGALREIKD